MNKTNILTYAMSLWVFGLLVTALYFAFGSNFIFGMLLGIAAFYLGLKIYKAMRFQI